AMAGPGESFVQDLFSMVKERRSFGRHPLWKKIGDGQVSRDGMKVFAAQFFLQVREFPRAVSALHSRCHDAAERLKLAESLYEEETGQLSGSAPHPELFIRFGTGLGMKREELTEAAPLPSTASLIDWFELSTKDRSLPRVSARSTSLPRGRSLPISVRLRGRWKSTTSSTASGSPSSMCTSWPTASTVR